MTDALQLGIVTTASAVALLALVRPLWRRRPAAGGAPCAKCASGKPCSDADTPPQSALIQITRRL